MVLLRYFHPRMHPTPSPPSTTHTYAHTHNQRHMHTLTHDGIINHYITFTPLCPTNTPNNPLQWMSFMSKNVPLSLIGHLGLLNESDCALCLCLPRPCTAESISKNKMKMHTIKSEAAGTQVLKQSH